MADPWACFQAGFWLSFVAVGVLIATDVAAHSKRARSRYAALLAMLCEQWVITLALTPLSLLLFGQVSLVGLLAKAVAIPWVTLVVTPLAMTGTLWPALWQLSHWATSLLMALLTWLARGPWATLAVAQAPAWVGAVGVVGGLDAGHSLAPAVARSRFAIADAGVAVAGSYPASGAIRGASGGHWSG
jgi:competence protein ComEC